MQDLNLPPAPLKLSRKGQTIYVFCEIRKKKLVLTPEEWVRQHVIHFLINHAKISAGRIVSEMGLKYNDMQRRADVVVLDSKGKPEILVECKAPEVPITKRTLTQVAAYNRVFQVPLLLMSNGLRHFTLDLRAEQIKVSEGFESLVS